MPTSTEKIPNTSATAASSGSDINGKAALNASMALRERLARVAKCVLQRPTEWRGKAMAGSGAAPEIIIDSVHEWESIQFENGFVFDSQNPKEKMTFSELLLEAYLNRQALTHQGYYKYPGIQFNKVTGQGCPFFYYTCGVAATEVAIDRYTGELKVMRTDLIMDLGRPINPDIDMGQVTGGFVQGMGWVTTENLYYNKGRLISCSPSTYKVPSVHDIPRKMNCRLIEKSPNPHNLRGSKAVGEPPLLLALSVWTAVKNALSYAHPGRTVTLKIPATQEQIYTRLNEEIR